MADANVPASGKKTALSTALWLAGFLLLAFALRSTFSINEGFDQESGRNLLVGNDPYYHWRTVSHVVNNGTNLNYDNAINYPEGNVNPNPPLWTWTTAPVAAILAKTTSLQDPVGTALNIMVAFWGALTVIPCFMVANDLWGRRAGLFSAFFIAVSAPHIQRSIWGYADHDAISLFFIVLAFAFLVKAMKALDARRYITSWRDGAAVSKGLKQTFATNRNAIVYAALAGISITACAVIWKGYPYALAVIAVAVALQLFVDHLRNRDTTAVYLVYLTVTAIAVLLPWALFYHSFPSFIGQTVAPSLYVLFGVLVVGLVLVPTRDLPSIVLVFPALVLAGVLGWFILTYIYPEMGAKIFSGLGYFTQSKLYSTIAEAQRPSLGQVAANFGFFAFLVAFWGFGRVVKKAYKGDAPNLFVAAWSAVAIFMTFAASRFLVNAAPVFAILFSYAVVRILALAGVGDEKRRFGTRRETPWKAGVTVGLVALFLIVPNVWTGVDASMGSNFEAHNHLVNYTRTDCGQASCPYAHTPRLGAFGIEFELAKGGQQAGWLPLMENLSTRDTSVPLEQRPAAIAWWDYGHWIVNIGAHPAVADPFQSHYELSGRFLASDSEQEAMTWLTIHLLNGDYREHAYHYSPEVLALLTGPLAPLATMPHGYGEYDAAYKVAHAALPGDNVYGFYPTLEQTMHRSVHYFAVDDRMYPFDDPRTAGVDSRGIFYAPVFLANKNPDDYMEFHFSGSTGPATAPQQVTLTVHQYGIDANNNSYQLARPTYVDQNGRSWVDYQGYAYPAGETPLQGFGTDHGFVLSSSQTMQPTAKFQATMYAKAFGSIDSRTPAGDGLTHWRLVNQTLEASNQPGVQVRRAALLEYYNGVEVSGKVLDDSGAPMANQEVSFMDGNGAHHAVATTDATGAFQVLAPFSDNGDLSLVVLGTGGKVIASEKRDDLQFSQADATAGSVHAGTVTITIKRGSAVGHVFVDGNGNGKFDTNETAIAGATVTVAGQTTKSNGPGDYAITDVQPGVYTGLVNATGYSPAQPQVTIVSGASTTTDIPLVPIPSAATISFVGSDGVGIPQVEVQVKGGASPTTLFTNATGIATTSLAPGDYSLTVNYTSTGSPAVHYAGQASLHVPFGGQPVAATIRNE